MPEYKYQAQDSKGKIVKGKADAFDEADLQKRFHDSGLLLLEAKPIIKQMALKPLKKPRLADFCRQLGTLIKAGVVLIKAIEIIANDESITDYERQLYLRLRDRIVQGVSLSTVMEELQPAFPPLLIFMIRAAETSGTLDTTCLRLAEQYTSEAQLEQTAKNSLTYPKILSVLIVIVVAILFGYVLPQFEDIFATLPELPLPTRILMAISDFVANKWYILAVVIVLAIIFGKMIVKIPAVRMLIDRIKVMGKWGKLTKIIYSGRFARTMSSLYSAGIPIHSCIEIAKSTIGNKYIEAQFDEVEKKVAGGMPLSSALVEVDGFVSKLPATIKVGEETGMLGNMLESVADDLDFYSKQALLKLTSYIEPVMIVVMAVAVGFIMISIIYPIYQSYQTIGAGS
ncbi:MAG: type II secretion system F family protein [Clostridiales bacterium]|nr:type II secretion system F family protein [Clostridiales bacterium]MBQ1297897.1 type II secretion system F family protein [Clostridiales bacterium]MBQ5769509.1 type II secretion system F family protein [Clostridiales bacterium]